jgi:hypothetical protein
MSLEEVTSEQIESLSSGHDTRRLSATTRRIARTEADICEKLGDFRPKKAGITEFF